MIQPTHCFIQSLPNDGKAVDSSNGGSKVCSNGLDVDVELPTLSSLDDRDPQDGKHN